MKDDDFPEATRLNNDRVYHEVRKLGVETYGFQPFFSARYGISSHIRDNVPFMAVKNYINNTFWSDDYDALLNSFKRQ